MRPTVILHQARSLDGRLTGFPVDAGLYYDVASRIPHDAALSGSGTLLAAAREHGVDLTGEDERMPPPSGDGPLLVVVDSGGRLPRLAWLRAQPVWRDLVVLCSHATPPQHRDRLRRLGVETIVTGAGHADLAAALHQLHEAYEVRTVRVDAGSTLAGVLLQAGLVDQVDVLLAPRLAEPAAALDLRDVARERDGHVRLRYAVSAPPAAAPGG